MCTICAGAQRDRTVYCCNTVMQEGKVQTLTGCIAYTGGTATCCECILAIQGTLKPLCCSVELTMNTEQHSPAQLWQEVKHSG